MSLRILFADDSMTAQNMGKKILTDAGYNVVMVSNGAAAVKKIAEQKPDIIILDIYMPGYTGLEVCERVRGSIETLKTPVLLTVGKMEPYKPEDANRVGADGVIVKPFEASDLLAIVKNFEERIGQTPASGMAQGAVSAPTVDEDTSPEPAVEHPESPIARTPQATLEVPYHIATSSAFSHLLGADPLDSFDQFNVNPTGESREVAPRPVSQPVSIPDYELPMSWGKEIEEREQARAITSSAPTELDEAHVSTSLRPRQIPVYQDGDEHRWPMEVVRTAPAPSGDIEIRFEPSLQEANAETTRAIDTESKEPGLVSNMQHEPEAASAVATEAADLAPIEAPSVSGESVLSGGEETSWNELPPGPRLVARAVNLDTVDSRSPESDFKSRIAAAMDTHRQASASESVEQSLTANPAGASPAAGEDNPLTAILSNPAWPPVFEYQQPVGTMQIAAQEPTEATRGKNFSQADAQSGSPAESETAEVPGPQAMAAQIEGSAPGTAGADSGSDHVHVAEAVHRAIERMKPELIEEIVRELKNKR